MLSDGTLYVPRTPAALFTFEVSLNRDGNAGTSVVRDRFPSSALLTSFPGGDSLTHASPLLLPGAQGRVPPGSLVAAALIRASSYLPGTGNACRRRHTDGDVEDHF